MSKLRNLKLERSYYEIEVYLDDIDINEAYSVNSKNVLKHNFGKYKIKVNGLEGMKPHFHIESDKFKSFVRIDTNMYFDHGDRICDHLSPEQCEKLNKILREKSKKYPNISEWEALRNTWNVANSNMLVDLSIEMPDYTKIRSNL